MTPVELFEYKLSWRDRAHKIPFHSDLKHYCMDWCKEKFPPHRWYFINYTDNYEHTMYFEQSADANMFLEYVNSFRK